jgi:hypothetical protein
MQFNRRFSVFYLIFFAAFPTWASDLTLQAKLLWGANDSSNGNYKAVDGGLSAKLHRLYKWNNYFEITNQVKSIPVNQSRDFKMSGQCVVRVKNLGDSRIEVSCIGKGKEDSKTSHVLGPTKWVVLGGDAKNNTAWFIGLREVDKSIAKNQ